MTAVVVEAIKPGTKRTHKRYRLPSEAEVRAADVQIEELNQVFLEIPFGSPSEQIPVGTSRHSGGSAFTAPLFGLDSWYKLFKQRQLFGLAMFSKQSRWALPLIEYVR